MEQSVQERRIGYYSEKMEDFQYGKEIRTYNLAPWFLEKYNKNGQHQGSIDPDTGEQTKPPVKGRKVEP